jgi:hypothetical protein
MHRRPALFVIADGAARDWKGVKTFGDAPRDSRGGLMLPLEGRIAGMR